jgi:hypothetical protein
VAVGNDLHRWHLVLEDREKVIAALERGQCDGILPAGVEFFDEFGQFCLELGLPQLLAKLPDGRRRRSIPAFFFGTILVHKALFRLRSLRLTGKVLFRSPELLRRLGFNWRQIHHGFYSNGEQKPFNEEALADYFAGLTATQLFRHQVQVARHLQRQLPELFAEGTFALDCRDIRVPAGHFKRREKHYKLCVLSVRYRGHAVPVLWRFVRAHMADVRVGKQVVKAAVRAFGAGVVRLLLPDRGFLDGGWMKQLKEQHGVDTVIGVRRDMLIFEDLMGLALLHEDEWQVAKPPKLHQKPLPKRFILGINELTTWEAYDGPLNACLIRDEYADRTVYQAAVSTDTSMTAAHIHRRKRERWELEETFMEFARYWNVDALGSCRAMVYAAQVHFTLLAFTLLFVFAAQRDSAAGRLAALGSMMVPSQKLVVYWRQYFSVLRPSQLLSIILDHLEAWQANRERLLEALRFCEGPPRGPP